MSAIVNAMSQLEKAVASLESSTHGIEGKLAGHQPDMFSAPPVNQNGNSNGKDVDVGAVAQRLDKAIANIESVLSEG